MALLNGWGESVSTEQGELCDCAASAYFFVCVSERCASELFPDLRQVLDTPKIFVSDTLHVQVKRSCLNFAHGLKSPPLFLQPNRALRKIAWERRDGGYEKSFKMFHFASLSRLQQIKASNNSTCKCAYFYEADVVTVEMHRLQVVENELTHRI